MFENLTKIPNEVVIHILKMNDIRSLSVMCCVSSGFNKVISEHKWDILDYIYKRDPNECHVPANKETYKAYRYIIDLTKKTKSGNHRWKLSNCLLYELLNEKKERTSNDNLTYLLTNYCLSEEFLSSSWDQFDIQFLIQHQQLPLNVTLKIIDKFINTPTYWILICRYQYLPLFLIDEYHEYIQWYSLSENKQTLTEDVIRKYKDKLVWPEVTKHGLVEELILEFTEIDTMSWRNISCYSVLSDNFIMTFIDKLDIPSLIVYQQLKDETIEMLIAVCDEKEWVWQKISDYQCLSYDFIMRNKKHLVLQKLISNKRISRRDLYLIFN